jgi:hypothetical protein
MGTIRPLRLGSAMAPRTDGAADPGYRFARPQGFDQKAEVGRITRLVYVWSRTVNTSIVDVPDQRFCGCDRTVWSSRSGFPLVSARAIARAIRFAPRNSESAPRSG